ncbi:MAG: galactose-1-phosphate uridylyltransferase [Acidobacteria bacterium]|nr:galactose-1-phosphate uridylyltransferase [Acidobacteriota bacterium]
MELRKDPVTRSWVVIREGPSKAWPAEHCPLCPGNEHLTPSPTLLTLPENSPAWQVRVFPHFDPLFRIEGETARVADGIYDRMNGVGAHEVIVELRDHDRHLSQASDEEISRVLEAYARRLLDLKKDDRFKYVSVFKNAGAGQEVPHSHSQVAATPFVPRRILHELRSARDYFELKERCLFCDMVRQELKEKTRLVEATDNYLALCPFASRVAYEVWVLPRRHAHCFERDPQASRYRAELAGLLRRSWQRLEQLVPDYHLALHTSPNTLTALERIGYWKSVEDDFHWHFELMPLPQHKPRPYLTKEVYFATVAPEAAAASLRSLPVDS